LFCFFEIVSLFVEHSEFVHGVQRLWMVGAEFFTLGLTLKHFTEELLHELAYSWSFLTEVLAEYRVKTVAKDFLLRYYGVNEVQEHRLWS